MALSRRSGCAKPGVLLRKTPFFALKVPKNKSRSRAKKKSLSWLSAAQQKNPRSFLCGRGIWGFALELPREVAWLSAPPTPAYTKYTTTSREPGCGIGGMVGKVYKPNANQERFFAMHRASIRNQHPRNTCKSRVAGLGRLMGLWEDIGISRPTGRRLPSEEEPSAGGEALKEEITKHEKREAGGWGPFLFWPAAASSS